MQREKSCNFSEAEKYLQETFLSRKEKEVVHFTQQLKKDDQQETEESKIKRATGLYEKSRLVMNDGDIEKQYLNKYRRLESVLEKLGKDIRANQMWDSNSKQYYPALIAFARDKDRNVTGGQSIYLDKGNSL
ncbi:MAG: hypothetical protein MRQ11_05065 [Candidatus Midichloria mitochondrii]|nr:hypothetical protein [Candidatus Midichloria mitochondrii]MDJ1299330.1 hypothetical protein [Candidatus Midichloria mitochondrii]MDJ1313453.1 hypothetical protein [Candidatus Midichloria mitochondrii]MDJ1584037.1 hypothetical protein [Candidatus Midichloria mitochondrii]